MSTKTAADLYAERLATAKSQLETISKLLDAHAKRAAKHPDDYGFAGDLGPVVVDLADIIEAMGGAS